MIQRRLLPFVLATAAVAFVRPDVSDACGAYVPAIVFVRSNGPDLPIARTLDGSTVGLLDGNHGIAELAIAYRHLAGLGFDEEERRSVEAAFATPTWDDHRTDAWIAARARVATSAPDYGDLGFTGPDYVYVDNCGADSFAHAARTLDARIAALGASASEVRRFVEAQDRVFRACARASDDAIAAPPTDASPREHADRAYQIAAQQMYLGRYDDALAGFRAIADDARSEWHALARYLVARVHVRKAYDAPARETELDAAIAVLDGVLADPTSVALHSPATRYRDFVLGRRDPRARVRALSVAIAAGHRGGSLGTELHDLDLLSNAADFVATTESDRFAVFVECLRTPGAASARRAAALHRATGSTVFLVAALAAMDSIADLPTADRASLFEAARRLAPTDPAFVTAVAHRARLLLGQPDTDRAAMRRALLAARDAIGRTRGPSSVHALTLLAFAYSDSADEAALLAGAETSVEEEYPPFEEFEPTFDVASRTYDFHAFGKRLLDSLPLSTWSRLARGTALPASARAQLATVGYARALLTDDPRVRAELAPLVAARFPSFADEIRAVERARSVDDRRYARIVLLLHATRLRTELDEDSRFEDVGFTSSATYYCTSLPASDVEGAFASRFAGELDRNVQRLLPTRGLGSRAAIAALPPAGVLLAREAIAMVAARPDDPRNPDLLAHAARASRWACSGPGTRRAARDAFALLHRRYPRSEAARATNYYYGTE